MKHIFFITFNSAQIIAIKRSCLLSNIKMINNNPSQDRVDTFESNFYKKHEIL